MNNFLLILIFSIVAIFVFLILLTILIPNIGEWKKVERVEDDDIQNDEEE